MPRRARIVLPDVTLHLIQRGNNRQACFYYTADYRNYLDWLQEYACQCACEVHAYVLMTNHVHVLLTPSKAESVVCPLFPISALFPPRVGFEPKYGLLTSQPVRFVPILRPYSTRPYWVM